MKKLYTKNDPSGLSSELLPRIMRVLDLLDVATNPNDLDVPGFGLHPLRGELKGYWSVRITGNYRIIFRLEDGDTYDVDLVDYH